MALFLPFAPCKSWSILLVTMTSFSTFITMINQNSTHFGATMASTHIQTSFLDSLVSPSHHVPEHKFKLPGTVSVTRSLYSYRLDGDLFSLHLPFFLFFFCLHSYINFWCWISNPPDPENISNFHVTKDHTISYRYVIFHENKLSENSRNIHNLWFTKKFLFKTNRHFRSFFFFSYQNNSLKTSLDEKVT